MNDTHTTHLTTEEIHSLSRIGTQLDTLVDRISTTIAVADIFDEAMSRGYTPSQGTTEVITNLICKYGRAAVDDVRNIRQQFRSLNIEKHIASCGEDGGNND